MNEISWQNHQLYKKPVLQHMKSHYETINHAGIRSEKQIIIIISWSNWFTVIVLFINLIFNDECLFVCENNKSKTE